MKYRILKVTTLVLSTLALASYLRAAPLTVEDVGDVESFGHPALFMGAASGFVTLDNACPAPSPSPNPNDQCFVLAPAPAPTTFDAVDICRINLPKKATRTMIYPVLNFFTNYQLENTSTVFQPLAFFKFNARISIESSALLDPSIIDPSTGVAAAGKLENVFAYNFEDDRSMQVGDRQRRREILVRVGNGGINKQFFVGQGVPQAAVDAMFAGPMTLRMSIRGSAKFLTDASITGNMRLFGD